MTTTEYKKINKQSEAKLQNAIIQYLLLKKFMVIRLNSSATTIDGRFIRSYMIKNFDNKDASKGVADLFIARGRLYCFIETKTLTGKLADSQKKFKELCKTLNIPYKKIDKFEDIVNLIG